MFKFIRGVRLEVGDFYLGSLDIYQGKTDILSIYIELRVHQLVLSRLLYCMKIGLEKKTLKNSGFNSSLKFIKYEKKKKSLF